MDFKQRQKTQQNLPESNKKVITKTKNISSQINSRCNPPTNLKIGTYVLVPNSTTQKGISKKLQPLRKRLYQIIDKPTDVTYKLTDLNKKEIVQHRNILLPYYSKSTPFENLLNYTLSQDLKLFKIIQITIKIKALICIPSKNN